MDGPLTASTCQDGRQKITSNGSHPWATTSILILQENVFQFHAVDAAGSALYRWQLRSAFNSRAPH
jgi:hypothetical protein